MSESCLWVTTVELGCRHDASQHAQFDFQILSFCDAAKVVGGYTYVCTFPTVDLCGSVFSVLCVQEALVVLCVI